MLEQTCTSCGATKPISEFYLRQKNPPKYKAQCKSCFAERQRAYQKTEQGRETGKRSAKKWRKENIELARKISREGNRKARAEDPRRFKSYELKAHYGITLDEYEALLAKQNGHCAICGAVEPGGMGMFHVDHCHGTGRIRGLLCTTCNAGLGHFKDNPETISKAIGYLNQRSQ